MLLFKNNNDKMKILYILKNWDRFSEIIIDSVITKQFSIYHKVVKIYSFF